MKKKILLALTLTAAIAGSSVGLTQLISMAQDSEDNKIITAETPESSIDEISELTAEQSEINCVSSGTGDEIADKDMSMQDAGIIIANAANTYLGVVNNGETITMQLADLPYYGRSMWSGDFTTDDGESIYGIVDSVTGKVHAICNFTQLPEDIVFIEERNEEEMCFVGAPDIVDYSALEDETYINTAYDYFRSMFEGYEIVEAKNVDLQYSGDLRGTTHKYGLAVSTALRLDNGSACVISMGKYTKEIKGFTFYPDGYDDSLCSPYANSYWSVF